MSSKKPSANDWQNFSLKKDIENLNDYVKRVGDVGSTLIIEIILAFGAVLLDRGFDFIREEIRIVLWWLCIIVLIVLPIGKHGIPAVRKLIRNHFNSINFKTDTEYVDSFDNEICYYVMMADSFFDLLKSTAHNDSKMTAFYFTETQFYLNKAASKLFEMESKLNQIFGRNIETVDRCKKVYTARLENILDIIVRIDNEIDKIALGQNDAVAFLTQEQKKQLCICSVYKKKIKSFVQKAVGDLDLDIERYRIHLNPCE